MWYACAHHRHCNIDFGAFYCNHIVIKYFLNATGHTFAVQKFYSVEWKGFADKFLMFYVRFGHKIFAAQRWMHKIVFDASVYDFLSATTEATAKAKAKAITQRKICQICTMIRSGK